jgi:ankyrin repeat protein
MNFADKYKYIYENIKRWSLCRETNVHNVRELLREYIIRELFHIPREDLIRLVTEVPNYVEEGFNHPLLEFIASNDDQYSLLVVLQILKQIDVLTSLNKFINKALFFALQNGSSMVIVHFLVELGHADDNCRDEKGNGPLHLAVELANCDIISYFVRKNLYLDSRNERDETPLHFAALRANDSEKL